MGVPCANYYRGLPSGLREGDRDLMLQRVIWVG